MARIYISRDSALGGAMALMHCYVNDQLVAKVKNGEDATFDTDEAVVKFRCHVPMGPHSDVYTLSIAGRRILMITVKVTASKPSITVQDKSAVLRVDKAMGYDRGNASFTTAASQYAPFNPTKTVGTYFALDGSSRQFAVAKGLLATYKHAAPYHYEELVDFELLEDGTSITKGGIGRAVVGAVLFGGIGAVVGGVTGKRQTKPICTSLMIKITLKNTAQPTDYIKLINSSTKKDSFTYKTAYNQAQEILSLLQLIVNDVSQKTAQDVYSAQQAAQREFHETIQQTVRQVAQQVPSQSISPVEELRKYRQLLDEGIITQEDFDAKKKQLLGI